jgi:hypothetical protein
MRTGHGELFWFTFFLFLKQRAIFPQLYHDEHALLFELWINDIWFVLDQHVVWDCHSARSLKQQFRGSHDTLHGHINTWYRFLQLYHFENSLRFHEMMIVSVLYYTNILSWMFAMLITETTVDRYTCRSHYPY